MTEANNRPVALIFGGTGGIGAATIKLFTKNNFQVYSTYYSNVKLAEELSALCNVEFYKTDISNFEQVKQSIQSIITKESKIDFLINCTSDQLKLKRFEDLSNEEINSDFNCIFHGTINCLKAVLPIFRKQNTGTYINFSSQAVRNCPSRMSSYSAAKAAAQNLCSSVAGEVANTGIRVISISPSFVETKIISKFPAFLLKMEKEKNPNNQLLQPDEIAKFVFEIIVDKAKAPNGSIFEIKSAADLSQNSSARE